MDRTLLAVYIGIMCAVMLGLLVWLIMQLVRQIRGKEGGSGGDVVQIDGGYYRLTKVGGEEENREEREGAATEAEPAAEEEPESEYEEYAAAEAGMLMPVDKDAVILKRGASLSYREAYAMLSAEQKEYADAIIAHAKGKDEATKATESGRYYNVSYKANKLVQVYVRKGTVVARLSVMNTSLTAYTDSANLNIKEKPIDIKVESGEKVGTVKDLIDLDYNNIQADRRRREEEKKARRRQRRLEMKQRREENK